MENNFNTIKLSLKLSCDDLKQSIDVAKEGLLTKYGKEHYAVKRLDEYYIIIKKQYEYISNIDDLVQKEDYVELVGLSNKIKAMAEMIKTDAQELIQEFYNGVPTLPNKDTWN